jgi:Xaa-Pro aminopeptidase
MLGFETLTLAPIDTRLVVPRLMTAAEIGWLDAYHARVRGTLSGDLDARERHWLAERTRPLAGD